MGVRQFIFIVCCASITGLSYLLSYCYIVIVNRLAGERTALYISAGAIAQWAFCALTAHFFFLIYNNVRRDKIAAVLVGIHTGVFLCLVIGATVVDQTNQSIDGLWLVLAIFSEVAMRITMEFFQVATIRDWIIEVSDNDNDMLMTSNTWYYILAVSIPGLMTLGGNHLFDMGLGVTGIVLTLGCTAILLQLVALAGIIFIVGSLRNNLDQEPDYVPECVPFVSNVSYFFKQSAWELSMGLDVESVGLISFGLFMRLFLANKGVTPYTISVLICLQAASAVISALFFPAIRRLFKGGYVITVCSVGKIVFAAVFLFVVFREKYTADIEEEMVIITHDAIFIAIEDYVPEDTAVKTWVIMGGSVLLAMFSQIDTLFSNQLIQESVLVGDRGRYAGVEFSFKYSFTLIKQILIASLAMRKLFLVLLILTFVCEIVKLFLTTKYVMKTRKETSLEQQLKLEKKGLIE